MTGPFGRLGPWQWVLGRGLCRFVHVDLSRVPSKELASALTLEVERLSPYPHTGHRLCIRQDQAMIWLWDQGVIDAALVQHGLPGRRVHVVPEEALVEPTSDGLRLLELAEGFLGQCWGHGVLLHSRWWSGEPGRAEWLAFQRSAGVLPDQQSYDLPELGAPVMWGPAWCDDAGRGARGLDPERLGVLTGAMALSLALGWYGAQWVGLAGLVRTASAEAGQLGEAAGRILKARREALSVLDRIHRLDSLSPYPEQLQLMASVAESLPRNGAKLTRWSFTGARLSIQVTAPSALSSSMLVEALQKRPEFADVGTEPSAAADGVNLTMKVKPR